MRETNYNALYAHGYADPNAPGNCSSGDVEVSLAVLPVICVVSWSVEKRTSLALR